MLGDRDTSACQNRLYIGCGNLPVLSGISLTALIFPHNPVVRGRAGADESIKDPTAFMA